MKEKIEGTLRNYFNYRSDKQVSECAEQIISLFKEIIPERKNNNYLSENSLLENQIRVLKADCYNQAIDEINNKIQ